MSDILDMLKAANANNPIPLAAEAIAEIERLRAAVRVLGKHAFKHKKVLDAQVLSKRGMATERDVFAAIMASNDAAAACDANPIARAAIDSAGGGE